jgi:hypothetical protein
MHAAHPNLHRLPVLWEGPVHRPAHGAAMAAQPLIASCRADVRMGARFACDVEMPEGGATVLSIVDRRIGFAVRRAGGDRGAFRFARR